MDINEQNDKEVEKLEKKLRKVYLQAQADTQAKMEDYLQRFATKDAIKLEQVKQGKITQAQYLEWRKGQIAVGKQWQDKVDALAADYTNANKIAMGMVRNDMAGTFATNHNYAAYQLEHDTSLDLSFTLYDQHTLKNLVAKDPGLLPLPSVDIPKDLRWNRQKINSVITQAVLQGDSIPKIAQSLRRVTDMNHSAAVRNARTSMTAAQNAGRVESYKHAQDMGIDMQQEWLATLDSRTRHSHRQMDGERIAVAKDKWHPAKFSNGCRYPGDPQGPAWEIYNCRCTLVAAIEGIDQSDAPRNSKLRGMSYDEWKNAHKATPPQTVTSATSAPIRMQGIRRTLGDDYANAMQTMLEFTEESGVKDAFYKYGDRLNAVPDAKGKGAYFNPGDRSVHLNPKYVANGDSIARPYQTAFHEFGHNIDFLAGFDKGDWLNGGSHFISSGYGNGKLARTIKKDWEDFKASEFKKNPLKYMLGDTEEEKLRYFRTILRSGASKADYSLFSDLTHKLRNGETTIQEILNHPKYGDRATKIVMKSTFDDYDAIGLIKGAAGGTVDKVAMGNVSDAMEFCTKISYPLGIGHGKSYWTNENGAVEFFAEVLDSKAANPASIKQMRKYFPNAVGVVEDILKEITK